MEFGIFNIICLMLNPFPCAWTKTLKDYPAECFTAKEIDDRTRLFSNYKIPTSSADDLSLKKGWYRIIGKEANSLKQGFEALTGDDQNPPNFCGTVYAGALMGEHPTPEQGIVEMTVCFRSSYCYYNHKLNQCSCKVKKIIYARNCLKHYIYWLSPTDAKARYCTGNIGMNGPLTTELQSYAIECNQYQVIDDRTRVWDRRANVKSDMKEGWHRFSTIAGSELSSGCEISETQHISRMAQPCGAAYRGYLPDRQPTLYEGRVSRRVCFASAGNCLCEFFTNIAVRNCGDYFVYRLQKTPIKNSRYCGASNDLLSKFKDSKKPLMKKLDNICNGYEVRYDPDRLWSYTSPTVKKCDAHFYGKFRFGSKYTPWSIIEGCNKTDMLVVTHRCGTSYQGFMEGQHPTVSEGYVERIICFQDSSAPCECSFTTIVGVQNCSGFYVYDMIGVPSCHSRFCMVANKTVNIRIDPGRPPIYDIPIPGYKPGVIELKTHKKDNKSLIITTSVLAIILLIVLVILILIVLLLLFCIWPLYRNRQKAKTRYQDKNIPLDVLHHSDSRISGSNGRLPIEQITIDNFDDLCEVSNNNDGLVDLSIPPRPSWSFEQPLIFSPDLPPLPSDDEDSDKKSPISDASFPELPDEVKYVVHSNRECDALLEKEHSSTSEEYTPFNSAV